ncbi:MAG: HipA N-terminal domain-containing protein [Candidatus Omnitrophota bacterium]
MNSKILRAAEVFFKDELAGYLYETQEGYAFIYDANFLKKDIAISVSLPPRKEPYELKELFPFFDGLLPEGWYLDLVLAKQKLERDDAFGILASTAGTDTIGAVTVRKASL